MKIQQSDITKMLNATLTLGGMYFITPDYRIRYWNTPDDDILIKDDNTKKEYVWHTYSDKIEHTNSTILNPIMDSVKPGKEVNHYYNSISAITISSIHRVMKLAMHMATNKVETSPEYMSIVSALSNKIKEADLNLLENLYNASAANFGNIYYNKRTKVATLKMGLDDTTGVFFKGFPKLKGKLKDTFVNLLKDILEVEHDKNISDVYTCKLDGYTSTIDSADKASPRFEAVVSVYIQIWDKLAKYMPIMGEVHEDSVETMEDLKELFKHVHAMKKKVGWLRPVKVGEMPVAPTSTSNNPKPIETRTVGSSVVSTPANPNVYVPEQQRPQPQPTDGDSRIYEGNRKYNQYAPTTSPMYQQVAEPHNDRIYSPDRAWRPVGNYYPNQAPQGGGHYRPQYHQNYNTPTYAAPQHAYVNPNYGHNYGRPQPNYYNVQTNQNYPR